VIVIQRAIARVVRYRKVYFPSEAQLAELVSSLRPLDLLRVFGSASVPSHHIRPVVQSEEKTTAIDLSKNVEVIYANMHTSCRYKVRRAEKMRDRFEIVTNSEAAVSDFLLMYNDFARNMGNVPLLTRRQFNELQPYADIFILYFEGRATCGRLVLRDKESRTALMMYSPSRRLDQGADTIAIGLLNRYLYWHELKTYKARGMDRYDFGGAGTPPSLTEFKLSFGGGLSTSRYFFYAGTPQIVWKLAHSLYEFRYDRRHNRIPGWRQNRALRFGARITRAGRNLMGG
jgi:hypothetical protein